METKQDKKTKIRNIFLVIFIAITLCVGAFLIYFFSVFYSVKVDVNLLNIYTNPIAIYDNLNAQMVKSSTISPCIKLEEINENTFNAFISVEDKTFFEHKGVNVKRMIKSFINNTLNGEIKEGASTITQQLIKNTHLTNEKTYERKIKEVALALEIEKLYSKEEILEMYLNAIYFGNGCYGIESASRFYFGVSAKNLNLSQSATLAGIIKSPSTYCPLKSNENITKRKNLILELMYEQGFIDKNECLEAQAMPVQLNLNSENDLSFDAYYYSCIDEASKILNLSPAQIASNNYKLYTYFDKDAAKNLLKNSENSTNALYNSIIVDNENYGVIAYTSSIKYAFNSLRRSPASTIKPILVYAPAIEQGLIQPCTILDDKKTDFNGYSPSNIFNKYYDKISATDALAKSLNVPAVYLLDKLGVQNAKNFVSKLGVKFDIEDNGLALALGGMKHGVTICELINAYSPFVSSGKMQYAHFIRQIVDKNGNVVYSAEQNNLNRSSKSNKNNQVMSAQTAFLVGDMMKNATQNGTCTALGSLGYEVHAKSGTNGSQSGDKCTDMISIAQTTSHTACVWFYSLDYTDENLLLPQSQTGLSPNIRIKNIFNELYKDKKPKNFIVPQGVEYVTLDKLDYQKGVLSIASKTAPKDYTISTYFNAQFAPTTLSKNFVHLAKPVLSYIKQENIVTLFFSLLPCQEYYLVINKQSGNTITSENIKIDKTDDNVQSMQITLDPNYTYTMHIKTNFLQSKISVTSNYLHFSHNEIEKTQNTLSFTQEQAKMAL